MSPSNYRGGVIGGAVIKLINPKKIKNSKNIFSIK
jgi:hypothetical protein